MKKILIFGGSGQLGQAFASKLTHKIVVSPILNFNQTDQLIKLLHDMTFPDLIIDVAGYTAVDKAESQPDQAHAINAIAPKILADYAAARRIPLVHVSTDYVFDGTKATPYTENDATNPLSVYGASKRAGEEAIMASGAPHLIFRTSWVISAVRSNFLKTMMRLFLTRPEVRVVNDQHGAPNVADDLAAAILHAVSLFQDHHSGLYHLSNTDYATWYDLARAIWEEMQRQNMPVVTQNLIPIATSDYPTPAQRPANSRLDAGKFSDTFGHVLPSWRDALPSLITAIGYDI
ncbi:MAG: dTDP-4-dehydrorhamnose reductase [Alphaproteobacteria bacterium]